MLYYIVPIVLPFVIAYTVHRLSDRLARQIVPIGQLARHRNTQEHRQARRQTLIALISGVITSGAFIVAFLAALIPLVGGASLIWLIGLFGAGIGFSAKPFIGDYMTGVMSIRRNPQCTQLQPRALYTRPCQATCTVLTANILRDLTRRNGRRCHD